MEEGVVVVVSRASTFELELCSLIRASCAWENSISKKVTKLSKISNPVVTYLLVLGQQQLLRIIVNSQHLQYQDEHVRTFILSSFFGGIDLEPQAAKEFRSRRRLGDSFSSCARMQSVECLKAYPSISGKKMISFRKKKYKIENNR